ncbi:MAG TPA: zinc transporter ZntB [Xanthomonadales bacterium]|nr:zinc transporter ZntB [Xanthomonadales bacterium]
MNTPAAIPRSGLIYAFDLDQKGGGEELDWEQVRSPPRTGHTRWVHVDFSQKEGRDWLVNDSGIDESMVEAMLQDDIRPRTLQTHKGVLTVLRGVNLNPGSDAEDMVSIRVWLENDRIISTRRRRSMSVDQIRQDLLTGDGPVGPGDLLVRVVENLGDRIAEVIESIDVAIEEAESRLEREHLRSYRGEFSQLRRKTAHVRRYLSPQREALDRLSRLQGDIFSASDLAALQEETNRMTLFVEELDLSRERAMVAQEEMLSSLAKEQNSKIYLLSIVSAIFLPLMFLTGLFGMNVAGLPGTAHPSSFNLITAMMLAIAIGILLLFRWKKWL